MKCCKIVAKFVESINKVSVVQKQKPNLLCKIEGFIKKGYLRSYTSSEDILLFINFKIGFFLFFFCVVPVNKGRLGTFKIIGSEVYAQDLYMLV